MFELYFAIDVQSTCNNCSTLFNFYQYSTDYLTTCKGTAWIALQCTVANTTYTARLFMKKTDDVNFFFLNIFVFCHVSHIVFVYLFYSKRLDYTHVSSPFLTDIPLYSCHYLKCSHLIKHKPPLFRNESYFPNGHALSNWCASLLPTTATSHGRLVVQHANAPVYFVRQDFRKLWCEKWKKEEKP